MWVVTRGRIIVADTMTPEMRSRVMRAIQGKNTTPELAVRRILTSIGIGYRLHVKALPGSPDIVMKGRKKIIEVRGCFWHRHEGCKRACTPASNKHYWEPKFAATVARDNRNEVALINGGWKLLTIWECEADDTMLLCRRITEFIGESIR
jgi:DNA mismatch endonuclease (patch repair protein)